jgi:hypothetical protein
MKQCLMPTLTLLKYLMKNPCLILSNNGPTPASLPVDDKKRVSVTSSVGKSSKNPKDPACDVTIFI